MADTAQDTCHHEFEGTDTCRWCGLVTAFTPEQEALIEKIVGRLLALDVPAEAVEPVREWVRDQRAVVTPSRTDRQPHPDVLSPTAQQRTDAGSGPA